MNEKRKKRKFMLFVNQIGVKEKKNNPNDILLRPIFKENVVCSILMRNDKHRDGDMIISIEDSNIQDDL